jgi:ATP-dependent DNA ligase
MAKSTSNRPRAHAPDLPKWVKPQLCKLVERPPQGPEWLHEIKYDGYRMHARLDHGKAQLLTRTGLDWTHKYPRVAAAGPGFDEGPAGLRAGAPPSPPMLAVCIVVGN